MVTWRTKCLCLLLPKQRLIWKRGFDTGVISSRASEEHSILIALVLSKSLRRFSSDFNVSSVEAKSVFCLQLIKT